MLAETGQGRYSEQTLRKNLVTVLEQLENDTELFQSLLRGFPDRIAAVKRAGGGQTDY